MLILGINTATNQNAVTLFTEKKVLAEKVWPAHQNEAETLLPNIKDLLRSHKQLNFRDLTALLIVAGPGAFTSLRIGVITANALAYALNIPQYAISTFEYYKKRLPANLQNENTKLFVSAGKHIAYFKDEKTPQTLEAIEAETATNQNPEKLKLYGNFLPQQIEELSAEIIPEEQLLSFAVAFLHTDFSTLKAQTQIEPLYIRPAHITMSKKISY